MTSFVFNTRKSSRPDYTDIYTLFYKDRDRRSLFADLSKMESISSREYTIEDVHYDINDRQAIADLVSQHAKHRQIILAIWTRDCDHVSGETFTMFDEHQLYAIYLEIDRAYDNAEGPVSWRILPPDTDELPQPVQDHLFEAHENGHPHLVSC